MTTLKRLLPLGLAAGLAAVLAGAALGAYGNARLRINSFDQAVKGGGVITVQLATAAADDATAKATIVAPRGYDVLLGQNVGTNLGTVDALGTAKALGGRQLPVRGSIVVANPGDYAKNTCAPGVHQAVWLLDLTAAEKSFKVPVYIDERSPEGLPLGSLTMQMCFASPDVAESAGGAVFGLKINRASLAFHDVFTNPASRGSFVWRTFLTPYAAGTARENTSGTVEVRGVVRLPSQLILSGVVNQRTGIVTLRGSVSAFEDAIGPGQIVRVYRGTTKRNATARVWKVVRTNARGNFSITTRLKHGQTRFFRAWVSVPARATGSPCAGTTVAPGGCVSATYDSWERFSLLTVKLHRR